MKTNKYSFLQTLFLAAVFILAGLSCSKEELPEDAAHSVDDSLNIHSRDDSVPFQKEDKPPNQGDERVSVQQEDSLIYQVDERPPYPEDKRPLSQMDSDTAAYDFKYTGFHISETKLEQQPNALLVIVEIEPSFLYPRIIGVSPESPSGHSASGFVQQKNASIVLGSGYVKSFRPISPAGLLIIDTMTINRIAVGDRPLDGIISIKNLKLNIEQVDGFSSDGVSGAFQAGPILVENGNNKINPAEPDRIRPANRGFLGIRADGTMIAGISDGPVNLYYLASYLAAPRESGGMGCMNAINLAGGGSETLVIQTPDSVIHYGNSHSRQSALIGFIPKK